MEKATGYIKLALEHINSIHPTVCIVKLSLDNWIFMTNNFESDIKFNGDEDMTLLEFTLDQHYRKSDTDIRYYYI